MKNFQLYNNLVKKKLADSIKDILELVQNKMVSNFCFYISCEKHPENLVPDNDEEYTTIVLENLFWNLDVDEDGFHVGVEINGIEEEIYICFESIVLFNDRKSSFILDFRSIKQINMDGLENEGIVLVDL